ncbi:unnamed protein product [Paramecium sonneborni]|uniref:Transmembrane protein n=1 Tax=Paramecium sonneborni TaxID=65129 RepID=A0A8S1QXE4_9CILI|nr:unnamed protein product [Paramecium sonneborni]
MENVMHVKVDMNYILAIVVLFAKIKLLLYYNNVMKTLLFVLIVNINVLYIVLIAILEYVFNVMKMLDGMFRLMEHVIPYVVMEQSLVQLKVVMMVILFRMMDVMVVNFNVILIVLLVSINSVYLAKLVINQFKIDVLQNVRIPFQYILNNVKMEIQLNMMDVLIANFNVLDIAQIANLGSVRSVINQMDGIYNQMELVKAYAETIQLLEKLKNVTIIPILLDLVINVNIHVNKIVQYVIKVCAVFVLKDINYYNQYKNAFKFVMMGLQLRLITYVRIIIICRMMAVILVKLVVNHLVLNVLQMDAKNVINKDGNQMNNNINVNLFVEMEQLYKMMSVMTQQIKTVFNVNINVKILV